VRGNDLGDRRLDAFVEHPAGFRGFRTSCRTFHEFHANRALQRNQRSTIYVSFGHTIQWPVDVHARGILQRPVGSEFRRAWHLLVLDRWFTAFA